MILLRYVLTLLTLTTSATTQGETLRDPTQLPSTVSSVQSTTEAVASGPVLQSIILSDAMRAAIINGERINIGEAFGQDKLVALTENSATLQSVDGQHKVLKMPHIDFGIKQPANKTYEENRPRMATKANP